MSTDLFEKWKSPMVDQAQPPSLVVVGSSAGGIEVLSTLMSTLPSDFPAPIVIAQHLDPQRPSHLSEILARRSHLPIHTILEQEKLEPGHVYVVPADRHVEISDGHLALRTNRQSRPVPSINLLFRSAAQTYGEGLIAVILTGTGSDGATGAVEVKGDGGTVVIQNPATAPYPSMPRSLPPGIVDFIANAEDMGALLTDLLASGADLNQPSEAKALQALLQHLYVRSGLDFTSYKMPTLQRRLHRRMVATKTSTLAAYRRFLLRHPDEYNRLISSFLIKVTEFFRDPALFGILREQILPELIASVRQRSSHHVGGWGGELRLWSAGCATGEEAYSLAILIADLLGDELEQFSVRIFATDLDNDAIAFARRGIYSASAVASLPQDLVTRFFDRVDGEYVVQKRVRALVIFGEHDLAQRAPFPRIDLVLCRNVLIYFTLELQKRVLQLFAYSLRDHGYLVLGKAETTSPLPEFFMPVQPSLKIYRRYGERLLIASAPMRLEPSLMSPPEHPATDLPATTRAQGNRASMNSLRLLGSQEKPRVRTSMEPLGALIFNLPIGVVVVDRRYDVQTINRAACDMLGIERSAIGEDLLHLSERVDTRALRQLIDTTLRGESSAPVEGIVATEADVGASRYLQVKGYTYGSDADTEGATRAFLMISEVAQAETVNEPSQQPRTLLAPNRAPATQATSQQTSDSALETGEAQTQRPDVERLNEPMRRLMDGNRTLHDANRELTTANLELHQANEEYLINAEEAQAAAEEVETLNEELQATNEELETLNEELQATVEELNATNDDLEARTAEMQDLAREQEGMRRASEDERAQLATLLSSMTDAVLLVDPNGNTLLTNRAYEQLFSDGLEAATWNDEDGNPLPPSAQPRQRAARGESFTLMSVLPDPQGQGLGRWFEAKGQPIINDGETRGGVVVIRDITDRSLRRLQDEFLALASHELRTPLTSAQVALQALLKRMEEAGDQDISQDIVRRWTGIAMRQVERLALLVSDLMDVGRLQTGRLRLQLQPISFDEVVAHVAEAAQLLSQNQPILTSLPEQRLTINGDLVRIEQVVFNLLTNAIKYAPQSSQIDVRVRRVQDQAELQVQDYGPGIASEKLPYVFSRYYQAAQSPSETQSGLGLGLFLTRELVTAHGGTIDVVSHLNAGTTFTVRLPLFREAGDGD
jgi:two-component system, chemotaxis family, CheB/CheR fusion protein